MGEAKTERIGETIFNSYNSKITIIGYKDKRNVTVKFENGYIKNCEYNQFKKGLIKSPYDKRLYNLGYIGEGDYDTSINYKTTIQYQHWYNLLRRCYNEKDRQKYPTYIGITVCDEWLCFQNFAEWFDNNYYTVDNEKMCLDKDILHKNNKIYSPDNCVFVPQRINLLFTKRQNYRGDCPIGVRLDKRCNKFEARCNIVENNKAKFKSLGQYTNPEDAFYLGYKPFKEKVIKDVAEEYKDKIPNKLYNALYRYEVEITD